MAIHLELEHNVDPADPPVKVERFVDGKFVGGMELSPPDDLSSWGGRQGRIKIRFSGLAEKEQTLSMRTTLRSGQVLESEHQLVKKNGEWHVVWTAPGPEPPSEPPSG